MGEEEDFRPRPYQEKLLNLVKEQNSIIYLPTGSGKTFIAVMLIKQMSASLDEGKRTFFMVNTVALVRQQAAYIRRHSHHSVGEYSGDMNVDVWSKEQWQEELSIHQILVMTCQIFLNLLLHGYIQLSGVNVLIFDECHHAVNDQPMRQVMQQFEHCPRELQPRVLGLTATLLNSNCKAGRVKEEVCALEKTFLSKVVTCRDTPLVERYSTNPIEKVVTFNEYDETENRPGMPVVQKGLSLLENVQAFVNAIVFESDEVVASGSQPPNTTLMNTNRGKANRKLKNLLTDVIFHIKSLGMFGGSLACLAHIIQLERMRKKAEDKLTKDVFTAVITSLLAVRKLFEDQMSDCVVKSQIFKYSSSKMLTLLEVLRHAMPKERVNVVCDACDADELNEESLSHILTCVKRKTKFCTLVFVERRFTAKIVNLVLKALKEADCDFDHISPDFIVGFNSNPFNETREGTLEKKWLQDCIQRFLDGRTNVLVASEVLEEGIDIPKCNLVVKFDTPNNYRSYIQSKGRARSQSSNYYIMVSRHKEKVFQAAYQNYRYTENALRNLLGGDTEDHEDPNEEDIAADLYESLIQPYVTSCSKVSLASAIPLINRYCSMLPQDKFTQLTPLWYLSKNNKSVYLQLPMVSPLRDAIKGQEMPSKKLAKRAAALETCKRLHQMGQLNENLLPVEHEEVSKETCSELFPLYQEEIEESVPQRGSSKRKQWYNKEFPATLSESRPKEGIELYLHAIEQRPVYPQPDASDNRKLVFYDLLRCSEGFAILSAKRMPKLCDFPVFMNVGEIKVHIESNAACVRATREDIEDLEAFSVMLFGQLLKLMKSFLIVDKDSKENSYFVVPTRVGDDGRHEILWDIVRQNTTMPDIQAPSVEERRALQVTDGLFQHSVVAPWYRGLLGDQVYIVTRLCPELTAASPFPSEHYTSYEDYYNEKYKLGIINRDQPLLEVKAVSNKINCLRPRSTKLSGVTSKRKRHELQEDYEENLVAELCMRLEFPSVLWLKATCLPTILHRVTYLLLAEELRHSIARDVGVGCVELPPGMEWKPLSVDCCAEDKHEEGLVQKSSLVSSMANVRVTEPPSPLTSTLFDWGGDKEPVDIDRNIEDVTLVEVLNYDDFISKPLSKKPEHMSVLNSGDHLQNITVNNAAICGDEPYIEVPIAILSTTVTGIGPQQCEILQALTSASANDILNLERLETLGDSFLKLMSSLYLFQHCKDMNEGELTCLKGKHIGNRNLYYCGVNRKLGGLMKVYDFGSASDWIPPSMCVDRKLQQVILSAEVSPNVLFELIIPRDEQLSGSLSSETRESLKNRLLSSAEDHSIHSSMENFLCVQTVSDKTIADGVEALIGAYLKGSGIRGALRLLGWLQILPAEVACTEKLLDSLPSSAHLSSSGNMEMHLEGVADLERRLCYKFRDRSFLLQAITHASYTSNRITDCYQRLEFLGDAVLDFLITCHIYESYGLLNPGELTDLRSALVNNVTFASLTVRYGFHKFIKYTSPKLMSLVDDFVKFQEHHNHVINEDVLILLEEGDVRIAEAVEVPKVLGDLFESLAGAIYLDSGLNLQEVWRVYYRLMRQEIAQFSKQVPKQPVRLLHELASQKPTFISRKVDSKLMMVSAGVYIGCKKRWFYGFGETKAQAKRAAAKCALKEIICK